MIIVQVRSHSPEFGIFPSFQSPAKVNGRPSFMVIVNGSLSLVWKLVQIKVAQADKLAALTRSSCRRSLGSGPER